MSHRQDDPAIWIAVAVTVGVAIGLDRMPYGYYTLLRLALCALSLFLLFGAHRKLVDWHQWALGASAAVYNPFIPVHLGTKDLWVLLNIATVILFWVVATTTSAFATLPEPKPQATSSDSVIDAQRVVPCPKCRQQLGVPTQARRPLIRCPRCREELRM